MQVKRIKETKEYETPFLTIKKVDFQLPDGKVLNYYTEEAKTDGVVVVAVDEKDNVILIKEWGYAIGEPMIVLPKGCVEKGLTILENANKELQEEAGFKASDLNEIGKLSFAANYFIINTHVVLARNLVHSKLDGDEEIKPEVMLYPFNKFEELIREGKLTDSRIIAALYMTRDYLARNQGKK